MSLIFVVEIIFEKIFMKIADLLIAKLWLQKTGKTKSSVKEFHTDVGNHPVLTPFGKKGKFFLLSLVLLKALVT